VKLALLGTFEKHKKAKRSSPVYILSVPIVNTLNVQ